MKKYGNVDNSKIFLYDCSTMISQNTHHEYTAEIPEFISLIDLHAY